VRFAAKMFAISRCPLWGPRPGRRKRAVYHFDGGLEQATRALRKINNHLESIQGGLIADPCRRHRFPDEGAKDHLGPRRRVQDLMGKGVKFQCARSAAQPQA